MLCVYGFMTEHVLSRFCFTAFKEDLACMIEEWATTGGSISDTKVDYLCRCIIPLVLCHAGVSLEADVWDTIPSDAQDVQKIVSAAAQMPEPMLVTREVCRQCHYLRNGESVCKRCPGKMVLVPGTDKKRIAGICDWGNESVLIWDIEDLIDDWLQVREIAVNLFNHCESDGVKNRSLDSERGTWWRKDFMDKICGGDQRAMLLASHNDGFAPMKSRPNDFSLTYGILSLLLGPKVRATVYAFCLEPVLR
jgi:hypothetical protein